jgi:predicted nucleotidyltransferase
MADDTFEKSKQKIIAIIAALVPEASIYLYGSRARGKHSQWSDIDVALDAGQELERLRVGELNDIMAALNIPYKVDVVDFHAVSEQMRNEILRDKVIWKP